MEADQREFVDSGFLILREVVPPDQLQEMRNSCERLLDRQREIWRRKCAPGDPPGGEWQLAKQPRVVMDSVVDRTTAHVIDFCLGETTMGVSERLLKAPIASPSMLCMLCSPPIGMGRTRWHRDITPSQLAPLCGLQQDMLDNGPALVQWNIALYDDDVLWVVPGSHRRRNTKAENTQWHYDAWAPMPDSIPVELKAGDAVAYSNMILHWGSNYTAKKRRTLHLAYRSFGTDIFPYYPGFSWDPGIFEHLSAEARELFECFYSCYGEEFDLIGDIFLAVVDGDEGRFYSGLSRLHPGERSRMTTMALLSKAARALPRFYDAHATSESRREAAGSFYPKLMDPLYHLFCAEEAALLWDRFKPLDDKLQAKTVQFEPMIHGSNSRYYIYDMPTEFEVDDFIACWN